MQEKTQIQAALTLIKQDQVKRAVLSTCTIGGMTNPQKVQYALQNENIDERTIRRKANWLAAPPAQHDFPPLLEVIEIAPEGSNGRPAKSYLLTEFGAAVLTALDPGNPVTAPSIRNPADLHHRYIIMALAQKAEVEGMSPRIEHPLRNHAQEIRVDLLMQMENVPLIVEVEQKLIRQNYKRILEKLLRLARFIAAEKSDERWQVQLVFNISPREEPTLVRYWQEAFNQAQEEFSELPYDLYYINAREALLTPSFSNALLQANLFTETELIANLLHDPIEVDEIQRPDDISDNTLLTFQAALDDLLEAPPERSLAALTELATQIYTASFYPNSPTMKSAVFPWASIWLMRRYLDDPRMAAVKRELSQSLTRIHKRNPGMVMLRETITSLLWDALLFHHGLGRGGPLSVVFQVPDFQDRSSDFRVEVRLSDSLHEKYTEEAKALGWLLGSIYLYRQHLGLIENTKK